MPNDEAGPKRPAHRPPYAPKEQDRTMVNVMVAGGIEQDAICAVLGITGKTLRKHFRHEIRTAVASVNATVVGAHIKRVKGGDFQAIKWWEQARMGWKEPPQEVGGIDGAPIAVEYSWAEPDKAPAPE